MKKQMVSAQTDQPGPRAGEKAQKYYKSQRIQLRRTPAQDQRGQARSRGDGRPGQEQGCLPGPVIIFFSRAHHHQREAAKSREDSPPGCLRKRQIRSQKIISKKQVTGNSTKTRPEATQRAGRETISWAWCRASWSSLERISVPRRAADHIHCQSRPKKLINVTQIHWWKTLKNGVLISL